MDEDTPLEPVPIAHQFQNCMPGTERRLCRWLALNVVGGVCLKLTELAPRLQRLLIADEYASRGDNCPGWPPEARKQ